MNTIKIVKGPEDALVELNGIEVGVLAYDDPGAIPLEVLEERVNWLIDLLRSHGNDVELVVESIE